MHADTLNAMYGLVLADGAYTISESFGSDLPDLVTYYGGSAAILDMVAWLVPQYVGFVAAGNSGE